MPIEPVKIPQNVQIEDRIIGPISLRQIIICMISGGLSYVLWNTFKSAGAVSSFYFLLAWTPFTIGAAFAFVTVQGLSLLRIILLMIEKSEKPTKRKFGPREGIAINIKAFYKTQADKGGVAAKANLDVTKGKLDDLSNLLDESVQDIDASKPEDDIDSTAEQTKPTEEKPSINEPTGRLAQAFNFSSDDTQSPPLIQDISPA